MDTDEYKEKIEREIKNLPESVRDRILSMQNISKEEEAESNRVWEEARKYNNLPIDQWPEFEVVWDLGKENRRYSLDNFDEKAYRKHYSDGLLAGEVDFQEFLLKLASHSQRTKDQLWETSGAQKLSRAILYFVEGNKMTPPLISYDKNGCLVVGGGFHRIGICLAKEVATMPILVRPSERIAIQNILTNVRWEDT